MLSTAKTLASGKYKDGLDAGLAKGLEQGRMEGEKQKAIEMARMMKADNEPLEKIMRYSGLTSDEIQKI